MRLDLHMHSQASDGALSPAALALAVHDAGIGLFALTDHDTLSGLEEAAKAADVLGLDMVTGVEISCTHHLAGGFGKCPIQARTLHIVALDFDPKRLEPFLCAQAATRQRRALKMVAQLAARIWHKTSFESASDLQTALCTALPDLVTRTHLANALYQFGLVSTPQAAFDQYLGDGKCAHVPTCWANLEETLKAIKNAGGQSVLAHPYAYRLSVTRLNRLVADFAHLGGVAVELGGSSMQARRALDRLIAKHGLLVSCGSDFHGAHLKHRLLGRTPKPNPSQIGVWTRFRVPRLLLDAPQEHRAQPLHKTL